MSRTITNPVTTSEPEEKGSWDTTTTLLAAAGLGAAGFIAYKYFFGDEKKPPEISKPISTKHQMQVEQKPDGTLVYHDRIKEEVDAINQEIAASRAKKPSSSDAEDRCGGVIFCGAPGSGKGTQCEKIVDELHYTHLSTGDLLRAAVKEGSELGKQAEGYMTAGKLVPDDLVIGLVNEKMENPDVIVSGWILDGFPRTAVQAQALKDAGCQPDKVILLEVPDDILLERITGRRSDPQTGKIYHIKFNPAPNAEIAARLTQRSDDTKEKLLPRLKAYHENVDAILEFYKKEEGVKVVRIDGNRAADVVYAQVKKELLTTQ